MPGVKCLKMPRMIVAIELSRPSQGRSGSMPSRSKAIGRPAVLGMVCALLVTACAGPMVQADALLQEVPMAEQTANDLIVLTGTRLTQGNAVDCPTLRDDQGVVHVVSYLSPAVAIDARVTVTGVYGITPSCLGTVLVVQEETMPGN